jgi:hypothetical protein
VRCDRDSAARLVLKYRLFLATSTPPKSFVNLVKLPWILSQLTECLFCSPKSDACKSIKITTGHRKLEYNGRSSPYFKGSGAESGRSSINSVRLGWPVLSAFEEGGSGAENVVSNSNDK